jgi:integrase
VMARPATGSVVERQLSGGATRYAIKFRHHGERVYETLGTDAEGWTHQRAQEALKDRLAQVRLGTYVAPRPAIRRANNPAVPTFHEFASRWFAMVEPELRESTAEVYRWHLSDHLLPFFMHHRLSDITVAEVDRYRQHKVRERDLLRARRDAGEATSTRPLSNETINKTIVRLGQVLDLAVEYGHLPANPARGKRRKLKVSTPQRSYLDTSGQIEALLSAAGELDSEARRDQRHVARRATLATFMFAGLRLGELLALRWRDVDLAAGWVTVGEAKTAAGTRRRVKIRGGLRDELAALKARTAGSPGSLVFPTSSGKQMSPSNVRNRVLAKTIARANERLAEAHDVPLPEGLTPYSLRRTFASLLYAIGEPAPVVMQELGHTHPGLALRIYAHAMRRDEGENVRLSALVGGDIFADQGVVDGSDLSVVRPPEPLVRDH